MITAAVIATGGFIALGGLNFSGSESVANAGMAGVVFTGLAFGRSCWHAFRDKDKGFVWFITISGILVCFWVIFFCAVLRKRFLE
jgi:hypothetical protein